MDERVRLEPSTRRPLLPFGLILVGLIALCGAVAYPFQRMFGAPSTSPAALRSPALVLPAEVSAVTLCLVLLAVVATVYGSLLLFVRL
jgi:hypothetical protein